MRKQEDIGVLLKGDIASKCGVSNNQYCLAHNWLRRIYGAADRCENASCIGKSTGYHYALIKGKEYKKDRNNFIMLCRSCHTKYDWDAEKHKALWETPLSAEARQKIGDAQRGRKKSKEELKKMSKRMSGNGNPMYGVRLMKEDNHFYGKRHTKETKERLSVLRATMTKEQICEIRALAKSGMPQKDIAQKFGLNWPKVSKIVNYKIYKTW